MKIAVKRFSVHQNAKVMAIVVAVSSLVLVLPFFFIVAFVGPKPPGLRAGAMILVLPLIYLLAGYITVAIGCWVYNLLAKVTGGLEFESTNVEA